MIPKRVVAPIALAIACTSVQSPTPPKTSSAPNGKPVASTAAPQSAAPAGAEAEAALAPKATRTPAPNAAVGARFARYRNQYADLTFDGSKKELELEPLEPERLPFDPASAKYFDRVTTSLDMTLEERAMLRKQGIVSVDHAQDFSMASAYYAIYARDLPVLVTTDSILHALHRSYDNILKQLELGLFTDTIDGVLSAVHDAIGRELGQSHPANVRESLGDLDLYVSVARNLLAGAGAPPSEDAANNNASKRNTGTYVRSKAGNEDAVASILEKIAAQRLERPDDGTRLYGGERPIDYTQFKPRGHYTESEELKRYFRTMMWLGRADTGFVLVEPKHRSGVQTRAARERRDAALLTTLMARTKTLERFSAMSDIIDFMVGKADNLTPQLLLPALSNAGFEAVSTFANDKKLASVFSNLETPSAQQIRSQVIRADRQGKDGTMPPSLFQLSGQRFIIDSFVLSKVVFDEIVFEGKKQLRNMPSGLDVMASLGNDEAVRLLEPELRQYRYSANLLAARRVVDDHTEASWRESLYATWLDALRVLDDVPSASPHFPAAMRGLAWQRKQLQTQLASWAELRHDTLLYAKQSYTSYTLCEYPTGYVEPYPAFYDKLETFAKEAQNRLAAADVSHPDPQKAKHMEATRDRQVRFLRRFESVMAFLEKLARKELAAKPFTDAEMAFLKQTIDSRGGGSGPPTYTGWYPGLIYDGAPTKYKPTVADVHTYPGDLAPPAVLEVATGRATFMVTAIDNERDYSLYVGPAYSYYEFTVPPSQRLDDPGWAARLSSNDAPSRPPWSAAFQPPAHKRHLARPPKRTERLDAKTQARLKKLFDESRKLHDQRRATEHAPTKARLNDRLERIHRTIAEITGACGCPPGDATCPCAN